MPNVINTQPAIELFVRRGADWLKSSDEKLNDANFRLSIFGQIRSALLVAKLCSARLCLMALAFLPLQAGDAPHRGSSLHSIYGRVVHSW